MNKICSKCKVNKDISEFHKRPDRPNGVRSSCKFCDKAKIYAYREKNKDSYNSYMREYRSKNSEQMKKIYKKSYDNNIEYTRKYCKENSKKRQKNNREWEKKFKEKNGCSYRAYLEKLNPKFKAVSCLRKRLLDSLKRNEWKKTTKFSIYIGCTKDFLIEHLESKFQTGMTWENHGLYGWHIDHIIPLSSAKNQEELYKLCHYSNLQPLWAKENILKSNKILEKVSNGTVG